MGIDALILGFSLLLHLVAVGRYVDRPLSDDLIQKLALEPMLTAASEGTKWQLTDLPHNELLWLRRWAIGNRDSIEKGLLPVGIVLAIIAISANTQTFTNAVDTAWNALVDWYLPLMTSEESLSPLVLVGRISLSIFVGLFVVSLITVLYRLFCNLVVHNLIIEACTLAEYTREQQCGPGSEIAPLGRPRGLFARLFSGRRKYEGMGER